MDEFDRRIVSRLQHEGNISMANLSESVGLSLSACHRRVRLLEERGVITGYAAQVDRKAIGLEFQVFIEAKLESQRQNVIGEFEAAVKRTPEIVECHLISGDFDYLLRVATTDTGAYEDVYRRVLSQLPSVTQLKTLLSLGSVKEFQGYNVY
ncbi:Lrp/AsnC family transcriptional regulator [Thalassovita sp.]|jgi:DNA-binding Lrp family transcriptional regulator|uniref:Lrp/AsnC family transcriptional regulator n=1 Tax=Thalassovita sp. TaxID=1979401 RepID=UPI003B5A9D3E